jgi:hypothetical protein
LHNFALFCVKNANIFAYFLAFIMRKNYKSSVSADDKPILILPWFTYIQRRPSFFTSIASHYFNVPISITHRAKCFLLHTDKRMFIKTDNGRACVHNLFSVNMLNAFDIVIIQPRVNCSPEKKACPIKYAGISEVGAWKFRCFVCFCDSVLIVFHFRIQ